jgi:hypothetical protein
LLEKGMSEEISILQEVPASTVWQVAAYCGHKHVLVGDGNHKDVGVFSAFVSGVPELLRGGVNHVFLERPEGLFGPVVRAFMNASGKTRESGQDVEELRKNLSMVKNGYLESEKGQQEFVDAHIRLMTEARAGKARIHSIQEAENIRKSLCIQYGYTAEREDFLYSQFSNCATVAQMHSARHPNDELLLYAHRLKQENLYNDRDRAGMLSNAVGAGRGATFYGAGHFRKGTGINAHLQSEDYVLIHVGSPQTIDIFAFGKEIPGTGKAEPPDFVLTGNSGNAYVMSTAKKRGLWPS